MSLADLAETPKTCHIDAMDDVRDYLEKKLQQARKERAPLEDSAAKMRRDLAATDARIKELLKTENDLERAIQALGKRERKKTEITIKDAILKALAEAPQGLTSNELMLALNEKFFDGALERTSMSPQLTRLKNKDRKIRSKGDRYVLA
jgi:septal ring factor EnvC (AmiA/AmiB activator)